METETSTATAWDAISTERRQEGARLEDSSTTSPTSARQRDQWLPLAKRPVAGTPTRPIRKDRWTLGFSTPPPPV